MSSRRAGTQLPTRVVAVMRTRFGPAAVVTAITSVATDAIVPVMTAGGTVGEAPSVGATGPSARRTIRVLSGTQPRIQCTSQVGDPRVYMLARVPHGYAPTRIIHAGGARLVGAEAGPRTAGCACSRPY